MASTRTSTAERKAQAELIQAERAGLVVRPIVCERCGFEPAHRMGIQAHHHIAYDQPLAVLWLCIKCHEVEHRQLRAEGRKVPLTTPYARTPNAPYDDV